MVALAGCRSVVVGCSLGCTFAGDGTSGKEVNGKNDHDSSHGNRWCHCLIDESSKALICEHDKGVHEEVNEGSRDDDSRTKVTKDLCTRTVESTLV